LYLEGVVTNGFLSFSTSVVLDAGEVWRGNTLARHLATEVELLGFTLVGDVVAETTLSLWVNGSSGRRRSLIRDIEAVSAKEVYRAAERVVVHWDTTFLDQ